MPAIKRYSRLLPHQELGEAVLTLNNQDWDVSGMSFKQMIETHEPEIRSADKVVLSSSEAGAWYYNHDAKTWVRREA